MRERPRLLLLLLGVAGLALALACGSDGGGGRDGPAAPTAAVPAEWQPFSRPGFSGRAAPDWELVVLGRDEFLELAARGLRESDVKDAAGVAGQLKDSPTSETVLLVLMDRQEESRNNINVQPCFPGEKQRSGQRTVELYRKDAGITAEVVSRIRHRDQSYDLVKARFYDHLDTYQVWIGEGDCVSIVTLTVRKGERTPLDDLRIFLASLEIDED